MYLRPRLSFLFTTRLMSPHCCLLSRGGGVILYFAAMVRNGFLLPSRADVAKAFFFWVVATSVLWEGSVLSGSECINGAMVWD